MKILIKTAVVVTLFELMGVVGCVRVLLLLMLGAHCILVKGSSWGKKNRKILKHHSFQFYCCYTQHTKLFCLGCHVTRTPWNHQCEVLNQAHLHWPDHGDLQLNTHRRQALQHPCLLHALVGGVKCSRHSRICNIDTAPSHILHITVHGESQSDKPSPSLLLPSPWSP